MREPAQTNRPAPDLRAEALVASYERTGYRRVAPAILQPADPFLDLSGEDIRKSMYLTTDPSGRELCLRPDLTIPVSCDYLASADRGRPAGFCYLGPIFRHRTDGPAELMQAGVESFGRADTAATDAEILALGLEATSHYGVERPEIRIGDVGLFMALIGALKLAPAWKRRLLKDFNRKTLLAHDLEQMTLRTANSHAEYQGVLAALAGSDPEAAHALVTDLLSIAGITTVGGRSVGEIADRFLEQAALGAGSGLPPDMRTLIEKFLTIAGEPGQAVKELRALTAAAGVSIAPALDLFESRTGFIAARGIDVARIRFSTAFGRGLDYYTGFVFELTDPQGRTADALVAGGRYDDLLTRLGAVTPTLPSPAGGGGIKGAGESIPAIGFAVWIERLAALGAAS